MIFLFCFGNCSYEIAGDDIEKLWQGVSHKAPLAVRKNKLFKAGKYTAMSLARGIAQLSDSCFGRRFVELSQTAYTAMSKGQREIKSGIVDGISAELGSTVFKLFQISSLRDFNFLLLQVQVAFQGISCACYRVQSKTSITWQTLLVHLCEVRQCWEKYGAAQLNAVIRAVKRADDLTPIRNDHRSLMEVAYVGRCHALHMIEKAAEHFNITLTTLSKSALASMKKTVPSKTVMRKLLVDMAETQLSPKLSLLFIPEWRAMQTTVPNVISKCTELTPNDVADMNLDELRRECQTLTGNSKEIKNLKRPDLLVYLQNKRRRAQ